MKVTVKTTGFKELEAALANDLPRATAKNTTRRAMINVMRSRIEARARELAPKERGQLADGIATKPAKAARASRTRYESSSTISVATGPTGRPEGGNAAWQEEGTVNMPANPYMRPAVDSEGEAVIADLRDELAAQIEKAKGRIARKLARGK